MAKTHYPKPANDIVRTFGRIVSFFFFGILLVTVIGYVDDRYKVDAELAVQEGIVGSSAEKTAQLQAFRSSAESIKKATGVWDERTVEESNLNRVQDKLVALAKKCECTLKKASPRGNLVRDFEPGTKGKAIALNNSSQPGIPGQPGNPGLPGMAKVAEYELHEAGLAVSIEGNLKNAMDFLEAIKKEKWICSTNQLVIRRDPSKSGNVALEMELGFQSLQRKAKQSNQEIGQPPRT